MDYWLIGELAFTGALVGLMYGSSHSYRAGLQDLRRRQLRAGAIAMTGGYAHLGDLARAWLPMWAAIPLALAMMFWLGMLIERVVLQHMIGQPVIMIIMVTFGIEIFLRGIMPRGRRRCGEAAEPRHSQAPIFLGEMLINRAYLVGGGRVGADHRRRHRLFNSRAGIIMRAVSDDQGASWSVGIRVERAIAVAWASPPARDRVGHPVGLDPGRRIGACHCC